MLIVNHKLKQLHNFFKTIIFFHEGEESPKKNKESHTFTDIWAVSGRLGCLGNMMTFRPIAISAAVVSLISITRKKTKFLLKVIPCGNNLRTL